MSNDPYVSKISCYDLNRSVCHFLTIIKCEGIKMEMSVINCFVFQGHVWRVKSGSSNRSGSDGWPSQPLGSPVITAQP